jgi:preprotein translocase subunit YajC
MKTTLCILILIISINMLYWAYKFFTFNRSERKAHKLMIKSLKPNDRIFVRTENSVKVVTIVGVSENYVRSIDEKMQYNTYFNHEIIEVV